MKTVIRSVSRLNNSMRVRLIVALALTWAVMYAACLIGAATAEMSAAESRGSREMLELELRSRVETSKGSGHYREDVRTVRWDPHKTVIIVCDMWNDHTCKGAARRVAELAPAVDRFLRAAREKGVFVIHAPSSNMSFYAETPQRRRAQEAPFAKAPVEIKWNRWDPMREGAPLKDIIDDGCSCSNPCPGFVEDKDGIRRWKSSGKYPWTRQIKTITIAPQDAVSDNGQEIYNLMHHRQLGQVIVLGVHTNICVSGRPFGLRQMVYYGKDVVLCRDLTDSIFQTKNSAVSHFRGTEMFVQHIERRICPTIVSSSVTGGPAFRFKADTRRDDGKPPRSG